MWLITLVAGACLFTRHDAMLLRSAPQPNGCAQAESNRRELKRLLAQRHARIDVDALAQPKDNRRAQAAGVLSYYDGKGKLLFQGRVRETCSAGE